MASAWSSARFPHFEQAVRQLTERHRELEDEPLHLALSYGPLREQQDIFLLEVIAGGEESSSPDKELFETTFEPNPGLPTGFDQRLHLILTNPDEIKTALEEEWPSAQEVADAVRRDDYTVLYADAVGNHVLDLIREAARRREGAARG
jgi:hypothetical protein